MEQLVINSKKGPLRVSWSNKERLAWYATQQAGCYHDDVSNVDWESPNRFEPLHNKHFKAWNQALWSQREKLGVFDIPNGATIVDIGCGAAVTDLLLYSYVPDSKIYLVDKEGEWPINLPPASVSYSVHHPFYNSWDIVKDAITSSNFDNNRFNMLSPLDQFPADADLIMSSYSYCYHYPKETYWSKIVKSLKPNGKLFLDVRVLDDKDIIEEISEDLKCKPTTIEHAPLPEYLDSKHVSAYRCLWTNNN
jgi:SAM-dependent methyltransferase